MGDIPMPVAFDPAAIHCESATDGSFAALGP